MVDTIIKPTVTTTTTSEPKKPVTDEICIVDLGRQSRRRIKHLRRGHGVLMRKITNAIEALQEEGIVADAGGGVVVLLVREKPTVSSLFDDDDDDDDYDDDDDD